LEVLLDIGHGPRWVSIDDWEPPDPEAPSDLPTVSWKKSVYNGRNYELFAYLASVRNRRGAGFERKMDRVRGEFLTDGGEPITPIREPRGMPPDASLEVKRSHEYWGQNGHSASWLTLAELVDFDWEGTTHVSRGIVSDPADAEYARKYNVSPRSYSQSVLFGRPADTSAARHEWAAKVAATDECEWTESAASACSDFLAALPLIIRRARKAGAKNLEDARLVFWFDN
jgi:hypothetical protein